MKYIYSEAGIRKITNRVNKQIKELNKWVLFLLYQFVSVLFVNLKAQGGKIDGKITKRQWANC